MNLNFTPPSCSKEKSQIPRVIHYCWFGNKPLDRAARNCIKSWKTYLPGYAIKCWDNRSLEAIENSFVKDAVADERWAFVADYIRLYALWEYGGVYFDTDVKLYTDMSNLLTAKLLIPTQKSVTTGYNLMSAVIASVPKHPFIKACLDYYSNLKYEPKNYRKIVINPIMSKILHDNWDYRYADTCQDLSDEIKILDRSYFGSDFDMDDSNSRNYYGIHFCNQSWVPSNRGWFYNFCKSNDLMAFYKSIVRYIGLFRKN